MENIFAFNLIKWKLIAGFLVLLFVAYQIGKHFSKPKPANKNIISRNETESEKEPEPETKPNKEIEPQIKEKVKQKNT